MTKLRSVQLSAFPEIQPDKPVGPILPSVFVGTNADLMAAVAPFYLEWAVTHGVEVNITFRAGPR